ncbi:MAG: glycosyl transferase family 51, partial [Frankiales bacterium]|nr:glycosyl transferase family 51 [Frankiales bacterium]
MTWWRERSRKGRVGIVLGTGLLLLLAAGGVAYATTSVPSPSKIATAQATRILYADGTEMGRVGTNRQIVPLSAVSVAAQHAVLAAEDRGFYTESAISPRGIVRALFTNVSGGGVSQGGSTITQQYAKNAFLTQQRTLTRKVKEALIAIKMSQSVSKSKILEDYLNTIYFGRG